MEAFALRQAGQGCQPGNFRCPQMRRIKRPATDGSPEVVVTGTVGDRPPAQRQCGRGKDGDRRAGIALAGQDVENDVSG